MKRIFTALLVLCLLCVGCAPKAHTPATGPSHESVPAGTQETKPNVALDYNVQFIRTNGYTSGAKYPGVQIIHSKQALDDYYAAHNAGYDLERKDAVYADTTIGFLDACDKYNTSFFEENYLIFVILEEGSGSVRHNIHHVERTHDGKIEISVESVLPGGFGTADMAQWHVILELERTEQLPSVNDIVIYWNDRLAFENGQVVEPGQAAKFQSAPTCHLASQDSEVSLEAVNYSWYAQQSDGMTLHTITDLTSRPISLERTQHWFIDSKYAETIYAPVPGQDIYEPTNSLGYFVKLHWDANPSNVSLSCWAEGEMEEKTVITHYGSGFYAWLGSCIYEIRATWEDTGAGFWGTATYYVYISDQPHTHTSAEVEQTVDDPISGYCGNTQTTVYMDGKKYTFMYGYSVALTDILINLDYKPEKVCKCLPEYTVDTELGTGYGINLSDSYARCEKGQADLTQEQVDKIAEILDWLKTTGASYD